MYAAYCRIFQRCGLRYLPVEAESGPIGGDASHEFMIPAENGEDVVVYCETCGYAANLQRAEIGARGVTRPDVPLQPVEKVATPNAGSIVQVCSLLTCKPEQMIKTLIYLIDGRPAAVLIRGDHDANENKIRRAAKAQSIQLADPETILRVTGAPVGFAGPVNMKERIPVYADEDVRGIANGITGANQSDAHLTGVNLDRDFTVDHFGDLRSAVDQDPCPRCHAFLAMRHAIEVGHVFKLGTKYSEALAARFLDAEEKQHTIIMGCYGIGINRILAGLIETNHDPNGIVWPVALAPYEVFLAPLKVSDEATMNMAEQLHDQLGSAGIEVLLDDRDQRAGVKFKDADLLGIPLRVVIGQRGLKQGQLEVKWRWDPEAQMIDADTAAETIADWIQHERQTGNRFQNWQQTRRAK
jgi:prolyl-tRNA synthetase